MTRAHGPPGGPKREAAAQKLAPRPLVLLAEDDSAQRDLLVEILEGEGYRVATAENAAEVVCRLADGPDAVLLDVRGVVDPSVRELLRGRAEPKALPAGNPAVLLLSADSMLPSIARELKAAYLAKPYDVVELLEALATALRTRGKAVHGS